MSEVIYKDYVPLNARIIVDYKAREKVRFSYPRRMSYWEAVWKNAYPTVAIFWLSLHATAFFYLGIYLFMPFLLLKSIFSPFILKGGKDTILNFARFFKDLLVPTMIALLYIFGIPALITIYLASNKERLSTWIPKIGYWSALLSCRTYHKTFTKEDVKGNKVIIPAYSNIYLDYNPTGDFNRYLEKIEVMEIPFEYETRSIFLPFKKNIEKNDNTFSAVFYFSRPINNGKMEVVFA